MALSSGSYIIQSVANSTVCMVSTDNNSMVVPGSCSGGALEVWNVSTLQYPPSTGLPTTWFIEQTGNFWSLDGSTIVLVPGAFNWIIAPANVTTPSVYSIQVLFTNNTCVGLNETIDNTSVSECNNADNQAWNFT